MPEYFCEIISERIAIRYQRMKKHPSPGPNAIKLRKKHIHNISFRHVYDTEVVQFQIPKSLHNLSKSEYFSFPDFSKKYSGKSL